MEAGYISFRGHTWAVALMFDTPALHCWNSQHRVLCGRAKVGTQPQSIRLLPQMGSDTACITVAPKTSVSA